MELVFMGWTKENVDFLRKYFYKLSDEEIAAKLGMSESAIRGKAYRLGL